MGAAGAKGRGRIKREATEAQIIAAFGRVVQRNGLRNVGVNEVLKEAGVGKALLYRYFGGLPGLVTAWGQKNRLWPQLADLVAQLDLTPAQWQGDPILVMLPSLNFIAAIVLAELHGRMGYFPPVVRTRPVANSLPRRFEVAEILDLQALREQARRQR